MLAARRPKQLQDRVEFPSAVAIHSQKYVFPYQVQQQRLLHFRCVMLNLDGGAIAASATTASRQTEKPIQPIGSADQEESRSTLPGVDCCNTTDAAVGSNFASNTCAGCVFDALGGDTSDKGKGWQCG